MDNIVFYQPPSASRGQPPRLPGAVMDSNAPGGHIASLSIPQTASQLNQQNGISKDQVNKSRCVSDLSQKSHTLGRRCRNISVEDQENLTATRNSPISDDEDFPEIDELLLGIRQKSMLASADPNSDDNDDDGFIDIDELLSSMQQKSVPASAPSNSGDMGQMVDNGTRGGSRTDSSRSTAGSIQDPIMLSDSESGSAESETDYSDLDIDVRAKSDSDRPHIADSELEDGDAFDSGAALNSDRLVADHQDDDNSSKNGVVGETQLRLSASHPRSASPDPRSDTHQASNLQVDTSIMQEPTSSVDVDVDVTNELVPEDCNVFAKGDDDNDVDNRSAENPASDSNISGLQDAQPDDIQSRQLALTATSLYQSHLKNDHLPQQRRRGATTIDRRKRQRMMAPIRLATTPNTASAQELFDDGSADDSDDEDYTDISDPAGSKRRGRPHSRKRVRRTKDKEHNDVDGPPTHPLDVLCQAAATSFSYTQESEEMPIHGYFTLKTVASKVVYCLTFSQELLPRQHQGQRQDCTTDLQESQSAAPVADPNPQWEIRKIIGQKMVGRERHYRVEWKDTWMPESELARAKELVDAFKANDASGTGGRKQPLKRSGPAIGQPDARGEEEIKRRRGRPRKYT